MTKLSDAERFMRTVAQRLPRARPNLRSLSGMQAFDGACAKVEAAIEQQADAARQLRESMSLQETLRLALALGNHVNGGTNRGAAYGFQFETLSKFAALKSSSRVCPTLLHFLVSELTKVDQDHLPEELSLVRSAASAPPLQQVSAEARALRRTLDQVQNAMKAEGGEGTPFCLKAVPFLAEAETRHAAILASVAEVEAAADGTLEFFGKRGNEPVSDRYHHFLQAVGAFAESFKKARSEIVRLAEEEAAREKRKAAAKEREEERQRVEAAGGEAKAAPAAAAGASKAAGGPVGGASDLFGQFFGAQEGANADQLAAQFCNIRSRLDQRRAAIEADDSDDDDETDWMDD